MFTKKGQLSIEVLIIIIFFITFIYVYNNLAEQTVYSLEVNKIKEQELTIALSVNEFLEAQKNILADSTIVDYNATYRLPTIAIASRKLTSCFVDINLDTQQLIVQTDYSNIHTDIDINLSSTDFNISGIISCGQTIVCDKPSTKIECRQI
ncbi:MAG TPA: hypothetical protein PLK55_00285 [archaeon]|jgi:hypothetical protein|nr:hypothetical protein [archaeon]